MGMIPAEAVEAAARAIFGDPSGETWALQMPELQERYRGDAREAVEAAAPYMLAKAWQEGYLFSYDQERGGNGALPIPVPKYLADDLVQWNPYMLNNEGEK